MFILELIIYILFAWIMYSFAIESEESHASDLQIDKYLWYYMIFFSIIAAIRWRVGMDSISYINIFRNGEVRDESSEFIWDHLVLFIHDVGLHFTIGTGLVAFFQIFSITYTLKKYRYILVWIPVVLFGGRYFLDLMNGVRQMMVACGFVFLSKYIVERKLSFFVVGVLLLSGIHRSALILLPTYLLAYLPYGRFNLADRRVLCLTLLLICFIIGRTPAFQGLIQYITPVMMSTGYAHHADYYADLLSEGDREVLSLGPIMISFLISSIAVIWFAPALKEEYGDKIECFELWYLLSLLFSCGYFLFCNAGHMMIRPVQYFEFFLVIMLSLLLNYMYENRQKYALCLMLVSIWACTFIGVYKDTGRPIENTTYKTYFGRLK